MNCKHCRLSNMVRIFVSGSISEYRGFLVRNCGFLFEIAAFLMGLGHYLTICYLRGMSFHLVDAFLIMNMRVSVKKIFQLLCLYSIQTPYFFNSQRILYLCFTYIRLYYLQLSRESRHMSSYAEHWVHLMVPFLMPLMKKYVHLMMNVQSVE